jgi:hypothetical protein
MKQTYEAETMICRLCLEPVTNFICTDCLFRDINKWLSPNSKRAEELKVLVAGKHASVRKVLSQDTNTTVCVSCHQKVGEIACPCCYLHEMHSVIGSVDPEAAKRFEQHFNFDFVFHHGMMQLNLWESIHGRLLSSRSFKPILIRDKDFGIDANTCDECGCESDELTEWNGQWLCESCMDENRVPA